MHLVIDGYGGDPEKLQDVDLIQGFLDEYPSTIGMTKVVPPQVYTYHGKVPGDWGVSGFVIIAESHISIHTFPEKDYVFMDVFSCRSFDVEKAFRLLANAFEAKKVIKKVVKRGKDFPRAHPEHMYIKT